jgi:hypothetical protein
MGENQESFADYSHCCEEGWSVYPKEFGFIEKNG